MKSKIKSNLFFLIVFSFSISSTSWAVHDNDVEVQANCQLSVTAGNNIVVQACFTNFENFPVTVNTILVALIANNASSNNFNNVSVFGPFRRGFSAVNLPAFGGPICRQKTVVTAPASASGTQALVKVIILDGSKTGSGDSCTVNIQ